MARRSGIANTDQAEAWNGDEGVHWATHQDRYDKMAGAFNDHLFGAAAIGTREAVLDIGCGNGQTTRRAGLLAVDGGAVGIDLSAVMLERARVTSASEGITNVRFEQGDAQVHPFPAATYDVAISRFGIMFFEDPGAAFANIGSALRPGGRLVFLCWQDLSGNEWLMVPASAALQHVPMPDLGAPGAPGPFSLADPEHVTGVLTGAGFDDVTTTPVEAPIVLGRDADDAVEFLRGTGMARALLDQADAATAERALATVTAALRPYEQPDGLRLGGAAWLVTATQP